jgi:hypothetical protein
MDGSILGASWCWRGSTFGGCDEDLIKWKEGRTEP